MPYKDMGKRREYTKRYMREVWYPKNRKKHILAVKRLKEKLATFLNNYKRKRSCSDCGLSGEKHPYILDFDHRVGTRKNFDVGSYMRHILSVRSLQKEITKCDLVCANCHRIRTWRNKKKK